MHGLQQISPISSSWAGRRVMAAPCEMHASCTDEGSILRTLEIKRPYGHKPHHLYMLLRTSDSRRFTQVL